MNTPKRSLHWLIVCVFGAVGVYPYLHLQPAKAEKATTVQASHLELTDDAGRVGAFWADGRDPTADDPNARRCVCELWRTSGYGFRQTEAAMDLIRSKDGSLSCRFWPFAHLRQRTEAPGGNWPLGDVAAIAHTHPRKGTVQYPSDPEDYLRTLDDYVVCAAGVFSAGKGCTKNKDKRACTKQLAGPNWYKEWCE